MRTKFGFIIIEIAILFTYLYMFLNSIIIFPLNVILSIICLLFIPGYNLLNLIKPEADLIEKLGYTTILSIAIENIFMFFIFVIGYNDENIRYISDVNRTVGFYFWYEMLIFILIMFSLVLIVLNALYYKPKERSLKLKINLNSINKKESRMALLIVIGFIFSLIFLCYSTFLNQIPETLFKIIREDYRYNFTFFYRVPFFFYIFFATTILSLALILFYIKNKYLSLFCISMFMYCLWILPVLQIGDYYGLDTLTLSENYDDYLFSGFFAYRPYCFQLQNYGSLRYSSNIFTAILLIQGSSVEPQVGLMLLYPLIFIFIPFLFYSIFSKLSSDKENNNKIIIFLVLIMALISPLTIKSAHSATTVVIGFLTFLIIVWEIYKWINKHDLKLKYTIVIFVLYLFLNLTHFEECIYLLVLLVLYSIYYLFFEIRNSNEDITTVLKNCKRFLFRIGFVFFILLLIFFFIQEFYGYFYYTISILENIPLLNIFNQLYIDSRVIIPILGGSYLISLSLLLAIILGFFAYLIMVYLFIFKYYHISEKFYEKIQEFYSNKILPLLKSVNSSKHFPLIFSAVIVGFLIILEIIYDIFLELDWTIVFEIILSYTYFIYIAIIFFKGFFYYNIQNKKQSFLLITIISCTPVMILLVLTLRLDNVGLAFSIFNSKFISYLLFFGLIILIDSNYFDDFMKRDHKKLFIFLIFLLLYGSFYSLKKLRFG